MTLVCSVDDCVSTVVIYKTMFECMRMLQKLLLMLRGEHINLNKNGSPLVCIALFWYLWVPGCGLEPFRRILCSGLEVSFPLRAFFPTPGCFSARVGSPRRKTLLQSNVHKR